MQFKNALTLVQGEQMNFIRVLLLILLAGLYLSSPVYADPSWSERMRGAWERIKNIGDGGVGAAEVVSGEKNFPANSEESGKNGHGNNNRGKGWERAKEVGGKARGSERSRHSRENGEKSWKK
ncbi:MAG: hypothetical protein HQL52_12840 [Magnetococcales bacterium]|nr:hypothetical protein [Magnetococcales bacterium]